MISAIAIPAVNKVKSAEKSPISPMTPTKYPPGEPGANNNPLIPGIKVNPRATKLAIIGLSKTFVKMDPGLLLGPSLPISLFSFDGLSSSSLYAEYSGAGAEAPLI